MVKKNGFISISIIYSFFIVFLLLLLLMMSTYVNNRFNFNIYKADIKKKLANTVAEPSGFSNFRDHIIELATLTEDQTTWKVKYENGYRFQGFSPRNYVWFNNEMWRVIGVFDSNSHGVSGKNLVKLIRVNSINNKFHTSESTNLWQSSFLRTYLNTNLSWTTTAESMIYTGVSWRVGNFTTGNITPGTAYTRERNTSGGVNTIGLIYPSDYAYAVLEEYCPRTTYLSQYDTTDVSNCVTANWLKIPSSEYTITPSSTSGRVYRINEQGNTTTALASVSMAVRPVVYLKETVKISGGDGSYDNPYTLIL